MRQAARAGGLEEGGAKGGATLDPCGYDAAKKVTGRKRHLLTGTLGEGH